MKIQYLHDTEKVSNPPVGAVYAIGNFDGVHLGHRRLFDICRTLAAKYGNAPVGAFTFDGIEKGGGRLISDADRAALLGECGADFVICEDFSAIRDMSPEAFVRNYLRDSLHPRAVVCGENFRFGARASGDARLLGELLAAEGIDHAAAETVVLGGEAVSTTRIKRELEEGNVAAAESLLGRRYSFALLVESGKHIGRKLGAPTANQLFSGNLFVPRHGVYATNVTVEHRKYRAVTNIGERPTFDDGNSITAESYIIGYDGEPLYGKTLRVELLEFLRPERKFDSPAALAEQIRSDTARAASVVE